MKITTFSTRHNVILGSGVTLGSTDEWQAPSLVAPLTNASGGNLVAGDVVVIDPSADESFTTTTTALVADRLVGVLADDIDDGEVGLVYVGGYVPFVNVNAVSVTRGEFLGTNTVAATAQAVATRQAGTFGQLLTGGTTPTAIIAVPDLGGGTSSLEVKEVDGSPDVTGVTQIIVPNGSLTDNTGGSVSIAFAGGAVTRAAIFGFDGGGTTLVAGKVQDVYLPVGGTPSSWHMFATGTGSATVDLWQCTEADFDDSAHPVVGDSICGGSPPSFSGAVKGASSSLGGWSALNAGSVLRAVLMDASGVTQLTLTVVYS